MAEAEMEIKMSLSLPRDAASVPVTRQVLDCCLQTLGVMPDTRGDIALALSEACANVILHAGPGQEYDVIASTRDGRCIIEVVDHDSRGPAVASAPRVPDVPPVPPAPRVPDDASLLSESGRGLQIIDAVSDKMSLIGKDGTTVHFEKILDWEPGALAERLLA
jgi:serine/threonine-protein kinase RsbW